MNVEQRADAEFRLGSAMAIMPPLDLPHYL